MSWLRPGQRDPAEPFARRDVVAALRRAAGLDPDPVLDEVYEPRDEEPPGRKPRWNVHGCHARRQRPDFT